MSITLWVQSAYALTERRFSLDDTVAQLKAKLEIITGVKAAHQRLSLTTSNTAKDGHDEHHQNQRFLFSLDEDERVIATYNVRDYLTLKVDSTDPAAHTNAQQFTDLSRVDKFELTREEYELRPDTVKSFKELHKLGRFAPPDLSLATNLTPEPLPPSFILNARCEISHSSELSKRGKIIFIGPTEFGLEAGKEIWIGVELDEPVGKGDGAVAGIRYFQTGALRASFVKQENLKVGDFPEIDPFADLEDEQST